MKYSIDNKVDKKAKKSVKPEETKPEEEVEAIFNIHSKKQPLDDNRAF